MCSVRLFLGSIVSSTGTPPNESAGSAAEETNAEQINAVLIAANRV
jgi:hypothetical protein